MASDPNIQWITTETGLHVPVKKGQSKGAAVKAAIARVKGKGGSGGGGGSSGSSSTSGGASKKGGISPDALTDTKTFSSDEIEATKAYQGEHYRNINQGMRKGNIDPQNAQRRDLIYKAMDKGKLQGDVTVYRGINERFADQLLTTKSMTDGGFQSTSTDLLAAENFAEMGGAKYNSNIIRFVATSGTPALNLASGGEGEILLKPSKYKPLKTEIITKGDKTIRYIDVERIEL